MLSNDQKETVRQWAEEGADLSDVHKRLKEELGIQMTYLDARLLVFELQVSLDKPAEPETDSSEAEVTDEITDVQSELEAAAKDLEAIEPEPAPLGGGSVDVTVDQVAQPHAMVSGRVRFSDGKGGAWYLDQMGRLGIDPDEEGHRPSQEDISAFQSQLQETLKSQGF